PTAKGHVAHHEGHHRKVLSFLDRDALDVMELLNKRFGKAPAGDRREGLRQQRTRRSLRTHALRSSRELFDLLDDGNVRELSLKVHRRAECEKADSFVNELVK
ncbi:hypothetical protein AAVH_37607, partial [Aphelenchoides avenae]